MKRLLVINVSTFLFGLGTSVMAYLRWNTGNPVWDFWAAWPVLTLALSATFTFWARGPLIAKVATLALIPLWIAITGFPAAMMMFDT